MIVGKRLVDCLYVDMDMDAVLLVQPNLDIMLEMCSLVLSEPSLVSLYRY